MKGSAPADCPMFDPRDRPMRQILDMCGGLAIAGTFACVVIFAVAYSAHDMRRESRRKINRR